MTSLIDLDTEGDRTTTPVVPTTITSYAISAGNSAASSIRSIRSSSSNSRPLSPKEKAEAKVAVLQQLDKLGDFIASMSPTQETTPSTIDTLGVGEEPVETTTEVVMDMTNDNNELILDRTLEKTNVTELSVSSSATLDEVSTMNESIPDSLIDQGNTSNVDVSNVTTTTTTTTATVVTETEAVESLNVEASLPTTTMESIDEFADFTDANNIAVATITEEEEEEDDFGDFGDFTASNTTHSRDVNLSEEAEAEDDDFGDFGDFGDFEDQGDFSTLNETTNEPVILNNNNNTDYETTSTELNSKPTQAMPWIDIASTTSDELSHHLADFLSNTQAIPMDDLNDDTADVHDTDTFNSLLESMDMPWETLVAPWNESDVFQWRQSKSRNQFLTSLGISVAINDDTSTHQIQGGDRSASPAITHIGSSSSSSLATNPNAITAIPLKKPSLSTDSRYNSRQSKPLSSSSNTSGKGRITDNFGFNSATSGRFDEARARQLVALHPDTLRSLSGPALIEMREELVKLEKSAVVDLHRLLDAREQARIDAELLNKSIELLVSQAQKRKENEIARRRKAASSGGFKERFSRMTGLRRTPTPDSSSSNQVKSNTGSNNTSNNNNNNNDNNNNGNSSSRNDTGNAHHRRQSM